MLELKDLLHLPQVDALIEQIVADGPGLVVVAGLDPRPLAGSGGGGGGFLPSGRSAIFRILMRQILTAHSRVRAVVVAETKDAVRIPNQLRRQVEFVWVKPPFTYADQITARRRAEFLVIDRLYEASAPAALETALKGLRVLSQIDTVFSGADIARHLLDLGVSRELLGGLTWVVAVQRLAALCPNCKQPDQPVPTRLAELRRRYTSWLSMGRSSGR